MKTQSRPEKATYVLGINDSHLSTATLLRNGELVAVVSEECFTRIKNQAGMPIHSIRYCLKSAGIDVNELDGVYFSGLTIPPLNYSAGSAPTKPVNLVTTIYQKVRHFHYFLLRKKIELIFPEIKVVNDAIYQLGVKFLVPEFLHTRKKQFLEQFPFQINNIHFVDHHTCHAYSALFSSPLVKSKKTILVFTADAQGDSLSATVSLYRNKRLSTIAKTPLSDSLGALYSEITQFLGMKANEHEYKVMGLAAYASDQHADTIYSIFEKLIWLDSKRLQFKTLISSDNFREYLRSHLVGFRFDYIAAALQKRTEDLLTSWVKHALIRYKSDSAVFGGGVFMNVKANQKIMETTPVKHAFFMPSCGDESNAIGAAYYGYLGITSAFPQKLQNLYLGPSYNDEMIEITLKKSSMYSKYRVSYVEAIEEKIVELLVQDTIVARFSGRMEWGARALGNRSILARADRLEVKNTINQMIKSRDFWMPFAPVILDSYRKKYIAGDHNIYAPYMIITANTTELARTHLKAALHPQDQTMRPQILDKSWNPTLYKILKLFSQETGMGGILNTSFNIHGEPIVCTPDDALSVFERTKLTHLALGHYLVIKRNIS